jgi:hypothetical protein
MYNKFNNNQNNSSSKSTKWSTSHSMGTILNSPLVSANFGNKDVSQLQTIRERNDSSGDDFVSNSETERLHETDVCDELIDENEQSFNWKLYKGIIYSSLSSVFFSLCSVIVKYLDVSQFLLTIVLDLF